MQAAVPPPGAATGSGADAGTANAVRLPQRPPTRRWLPRPHPRQSLSTVGRWRPTPPRPTMRARPAKVSANHCRRTPCGASCHGSVPPRPCDALGRERGPGPAGVCAPLPAMRDARLAGRRRPPARCARDRSPLGRRRRRAALRATVGMPQLNSRPPPPLCLAAADSELRVSVDPAICPFPPRRPTILPPSPCD